MLIPISLGNQSDLSKVLLVLYVHKQSIGQMQRYEAVALLKELGAGLLNQPTLVMIEQRTPDSFQLIVKGDYDRREVEMFIQKFDLVVKEDTDKGHLLIFKP